MKLKTGSKSGQLSLDVLVGLTVFMVTFIFILQYLPSIFVVQRSDISLSSDAYRISALLTESPGYWTNGTCNGTNWEDHWKDSEVTVRAGLCDGKMCELSIPKILNFSEMYEQEGYDSIANMFGIENYNISLQYVYSNTSYPVYSYYNGKPLLLIGKPIPKFKDIVKYCRIVYLNNASFTYDITTSEYGVNKTKILNVTAPVGVFTFVVTKTQIWGNGSGSWIIVKISKGNGWGGEKILRIPSNGGSLSPGVYNVAGQISAISGTVNLTVISHNLAGYLIYSSAGQYIAGRIVAKLVVCVW